MKRSTTATHLVVLAVVSLVAQRTDGYPFRDVTQAVGLGNQKAQRKFGGAAVADLDGDGRPDIILGQHNEPYAHIYFNSENGRFKKSSWKLWGDIHGINPFRAGPRARGMYFSLSYGGAYGLKPTYPRLFHVTSSRRIIEITKGSGMDVDSVRGRGRSVLFVNLRNGRSGAPDALSTNAIYPNETGVHQFAFEGRGKGRFAQKRIAGFGEVRASYTTVTDVDGDGNMEILSFQQLRMHSVTAPFRLRDISTRVFPQNVLRHQLGVAAIAEIDYDNDGKWDLYIARATTGNLRWLKSDNSGDFLLRNVGGRYVDVSKEAGIPSSSQTRGVTVGDFNNDGWSDILLIQFASADLIYLNNGDGTFTRRFLNVGRKRNVRGDMATAVDYDGDGRLDVILSEGNWIGDKYTGTYRVMKNIGTTGKSILVRVGNSPEGGATSLHAVAKAFIVGESVKIRRVGSPGTATSNSYIELLHFGIGKADVVRKVVVQWTDGSSQAKYQIKAGSLTKFGS